MLIGKFSKQPYEAFYFGANFGNVIDSDKESINLSLSSIAAVDSAGSTVTDIYEVGTMIVVNNTILAIRLKAGVENLSPYAITYRIVTTQGNKFEKDIQMEIIEV